MKGAVDRNQRTATAAVGPGATPAHLLTHPLMIASVVVLVANDHWAKARFANVATGKLSDAAGSLVLAVLVAIGWAMVAGWRTTGSLRAPVVTPGHAIKAALVVVGAVAAAKTSAFGAQMAAWLLGVARWPLDVVVGLCTGADLAGPRAVVVLVDATDVLAALCAVAVVAMLGGVTDGDSDVQAGGGAQVRTTEGGC